MTDSIQLTVCDDILKGFVSVQKSKWFRLGDMLIFRTYLKSNWSKNISKDIPGNVIHTRHRIRFKSQYECLPKP